MSGEQRRRVVETVAHKLAERATSMPAYLVDEETFDGWLQEAEDRVSHTPKPLAKVKLLPDGAAAVKAPSDWRPRDRSIVVQRETEVLVEGHALLYLDIGTGPELGLEMTPGGRVKVWVYVDGAAEDEPAARWEFDPFSEPHSGQPGDQG